MKVSIAMATYNGAKHLEAQLLSFVEQTRLPDELIITDDCSTDETETVILEFAKTAPFKVEFHRNEKNLGYSGNFNSALTKTTGDLVFLSDQDDVWFPEKMEYMLDVAERNPEALVLMNDAALTDGFLREVGLTKVGQIRAAGFSTKKFKMGCCSCIRRDLLDFCLPIPAAFLAHDTWIIGFAQGLGAKILDERVLQYYRRHDSNESHFIANRTTKVNRYQAFLDGLKKTVDGDTRAREQAQLEQLKLFADGVKVALSKAPEEYRQGLGELLEVKEQRVRSLRTRSEIRHKKFLARFASTLALLLRGGYRNTRGVQSVFRDLVG